MLGTGITAGCPVVWSVLVHFRLITRPGTWIDTSPQREWHVTSNIEGRERAKSLWRKNPKNARKTPHFATSPMEPSRSQTLHISFSNSWAWVRADNWLNAWAWHQVNYGKFWQYSNSSALTWVKWVFRQGTLHTSKAHPGLDPRKGGHVWGRTRDRMISGSVGLLLFQAGKQPTIAAWQQPGDIPKWALQNHRRTQDNTDENNNNYS